MLLTERSYLILQMLELQGQILYLQGFVVIDVVADCSMYVMLLLDVPPQVRETMK